MRDPLLCARKMTASLAHLGRLDEARACAKRLMERFPNFSISHWADVPPYRDRRTLAATARRRHHIDYIGAIFGASEDVAVQSIRRRFDLACGDRVALLPTGT
jgi:hypothetical protein